jgi:hypothetical protein
MPNPLVVVLGLGSTLGFGISTRPAVGVTGDVGIHWSFDDAAIDGFSLSLGARWDPPAAAHLDGRPEGTRVVISRLLGTVTPCAHFWKLVGCLRFELGPQQYGAENEAISGNDRVVYAGVGGRLGVEVPLVPHLGMRVYGDVIAPLTTLRLESGNGTVWQTPLVSGTVGAGVYVSF